MYYYYFCIHYNYQCSLSVIIVYPLSLGTIIILCNHIFFFSVYFIRPTPLFLFYIIVCCVVVVYHLLQKVASLLCFFDPLLKQSLYYYVLFATTVSTKSLLYFIYYCNVHLVAHCSYYYCTLCRCYTPIHSIKHDLLPKTERVSHYYYYYYHPHHNERVVRVSPPATYVV